VVECGEAEPNQAEKTLLSAQQAKTARATLGWFQRKDVSSRLAGTGSSSDTLAAETWNADRQPLLRGLEELLDLLPVGGSLTSIRPSPELRELRKKTSGTELALSDRFSFPHAGHPLGASITPSGPDRP
jgi:hypothetical protein